MKFGFLAALVLSAFVFSSCVTHKKQIIEEKPVIKDIFSAPDGYVVKARLGNAELKLAVANSPKAKEEGLSNKKEIPEDGMIFFFYEPDNLSFWMKDMLFPIDIIWIADNKVIGIEKNVPVPIAHAKTEDLKIYRSPGKADIVVELEAGAADKLNIAEGSPLEIEMR